MLSMRSKFTNIRVYHIIFLLGTGKNCRFGVMIVPGIFLSNDCHDYVFLARQLRLSEFSQKQRKFGNKRALLFKSRKYRNILHSAGQELVALNISSICMLCASVGYTYACHCLRAVSRSLTVDNTDLVRVQCVAGPRSKIYAINFSNVSRLYVFCLHQINIHVSITTRGVIKLEKSKQHSTGPRSM